MKDKKPDEMRMKASEFHKMMRHALGAPPLPERNQKAANRTKKKAQPKK